MLIMLSDETRITHHLNMSEQNSMNGGNGEARQNNSIHSCHEMPSIDYLSPFDMNTEVNLYGSGSLNYHNSTSEEMISLEKDMNAISQKGKFIII